MHAPPYFHFMKYVFYFWKVLFGCLHISFFFLSCSHPPYLLEHVEHITLARPAGHGNTDLSASPQEVDMESPEFGV